MSFPRYPKYKPSGVEWLGEVPEHWEVHKLGRLGRFRAGAGFPDAHQGQLGLPIPFFKVGDLNRADSRGAMVEAQHTITADTAATLRAAIFPPSAIVFAKVGAALLLQRFRWLDRSACIDNNMMGFELSPAADLRFTLYRLPLIDLSRIANPGAVPSINEGQLSELRLALPPLPEQRAIAAFLDRETAKIDGLVAEQQRLIELLKEKRQAVISHAVTKGLDPKAPMKPSGVEWLGDVPAHWEVQRLGNLLREFPCYGVLVPDFEIDGVPMLRIQDMTASSIARNDLTTISRSLSQQYSRTVVEVGDLVLSVVGTIGQSLVIDAELAGVNLSRAVARLQMRDLLLPQVCRWIFCSDYFRQYVDLVCVGTAQRVLNMADLRAFKVAIPPQGEQSAIIAALDAKTCGIDVLLAEAESAITLLQERRSALISAAVTGQIDVRNAVATEAA